MFDAEFTSNPCQVFDVSLICIFDPFFISSLMSVI